MRTPAVVLVFLAAACSAGVAGGPPPLQAAGTNGNVGTFGLDPHPGDVSIVGLAGMRVNEPVTLESVSLDMAEGQAELLAARVSAGSATGSYCSTGGWPPKGYGGSAEVNGYQARPGDTPALVLYLRRQSDRAASEAIVVTYRDSDGDRRTLRIVNAGFEIVPPEGPPRADRCPSPRWVD